MHTSNHINHQQHKRNIVESICRLYTFRLHTLLFGICITNSSDPDCPVNRLAAMPEPPASAWHRNNSYQWRSTTNRLHPFHIIWANLHFILQLQVIIKIEWSPSFCKVKTMRQTSARTSLMSFSAEAMESGVPISSTILLWELGSASISRVTWILAPDCNWRYLMVSPPLPIMTPTLPLGISIFLIVPWCP